MRRCRRRAAGRRAPAARARRSRALEGIITPSSLHFERHHNGVPDIDPDSSSGADPRPRRAAADLQHRGACRAIRWCRASSSSSAPATAPRTTAPRRRSSPPAASTGSCRAAIGLACRSAILLEEAGVKPEGKWLLAEGADAAGMSRSVPMAKAHGRRDPRALPKRRASAAGATATPCACSCRATKAT